MRLRWTPAAAADLEDISDYLKQHHPNYRQRTMRKLYDTIRSLQQMPERGRPGSEEGTREILFSPMPYIAVYRIKEQTIAAESSAAKSYGTAGISSAAPVATS